MNSKDEEQQRKYHEEELKRVMNDFRILFYSCDYLTQAFLMITVPILILSCLLFCVSYALFNIPLFLLNIFNKTNKK